jgi:hypothetical protein
MWQPLMGLKIPDLACRFVSLPRHDMDLPVTPRMTALELAASAGSIPEATCCVSRRPLYRFVACGTNVRF